MVRKKILIWGCAVALTSFLVTVTLSIIFQASPIEAIGGLIAQTGGFVMLFLGIWLYKAKRIKKKLGVVS